MEVSIPYTFTAADGSRFVVGNSAAARADADWIGYLDADTPFVGLLDGAPGRATITPVTAGDGARIGPGYRAARSGTVNGMLDPNATTAVREAAQAKVRRAMFAAMSADAVLSWTPTGDLARQLRVRAHVPPDFRGRQPTTFMLTLVSSDVLVLGAALQTLTQTITPGGGAAGAASANATNAGPVATWPWFELAGAITTISISVAGVGLSLLPYDQLAGEKTIILPERGLVIHETAGGVQTDRSGSVMAGGAWPMLPSGVSACATVTGSNATGATFKTMWRPAWP